MIRTGTFGLFAGLFSKQPADLLALKRLEAAENKRAKSLLLLLGSVKEEVVQKHPPPRRPPRLLRRYFPFEKTNPVLVPVLLECIVFFLLF